MHESTQLALSVKPIKHQEIDKIAMGVLPSGETYLSLNGLAKFCGVAPSVIIALSQQWQNGEALNKDRGRKIAELIRSWSDDERLPESLYVKITSGNLLHPFIHAVPDTVAMAIVDYYAHYAKNKNEAALENFRRAAQYGLRRYIYDRLGYQQEQLIDEVWSIFQNRILMNEIPMGYFTAFQESTPIIASMIKHQVPIDDRTLPDLSIGMAWSKHWQTNSFDNEHGKRHKIVHHFPYSFRQHSEVEVWAYPNPALGVFRDWLHQVYIKEKYQKYLDGKQKQGLLSEQDIPQLVAAVTAPTLSEVKKID